MEKFTLRPHTSTCFLPLPITRTSHHLLRFQFYPSPSSPTLRLRPRPRVAVASSSSSSSSKSKVLNGLRVDNVARRQQEQQAPPVSASEDVSKIVGIWPPWKNIPQRYKLIGTTSLAFVICNMDKVNLSIAIIPMSHQFGWNSSMAGLVQSSFFWGYALSQLPGGWLAKTFGGRKVLEVGVLVWSVATAFVPLVAGYMPGLLLSRILVGIGEGVSPSAATDLIARSIPLEERSRAVAFVFGGLSVGSVMGLLLAPPLIQSLGWESVFYLFGFLGVAWFLGFQVLDGGEAQLNAGSLSFTGVQGTMTQSWKSSLKELNSSLKDVPWKSFFRSPAVWAMIYAHFCGSWGHYTCLSWLPTYFSEELNLNLTEAAWVSILPPLASVFATNIAAQLADNLIARGVETTTVRKICQSIAFLSPAICMTLSSLDLGLPPWEIVSILTGGLALSSFALSGLYCTHQDMSPEYASILLGITNTVGAIPGIVGVALTGYLLDSTHSWSISLFVPSIFFYLTGTFIWLAFASSKPQSFSEEN
ncbi:probable anion transporter 6, chloroplastic [Arachis duranensis]|uniref:Probable anion transporter 6, chloroplastic n=1 Tax=Arachis duranensis TaxID=130453 RepID=A0A6P4BC84_ARADU|nr:probable anion transporter 6, chloroplastic [Arachis duranensis]